MRDDDPPGILERFGEFLESGAADSGAEQCLQLDNIGNRLDFLTKTLWNLLESNFQRFKDILLLGEDQTFLMAFLAELFGERTRFFATFLAELFGE